MSVVALCSFECLQTLPINQSGGPLPEEYGPRRQIERELQRQDPYNYFYLEVEATRVR
jgi:hypothetical protein